MSTSAARPLGAAASGDGGAVLYSDRLLTVTRTASPPGLLVVGEIDFSNAGAWREALTEATVSGQDMHLDLSGLRFTDVSGARALAEAAERLGPRPLILHNPGRATRRVLQLAGWDQLPNIVVRESRSHR